MTLYEMDEKNNYYSEVIKKRTAEKPKYNHAILNDSVAQEGTNTDHYPKVVNGYWYVYDPLMGGFVSTGIKASVTEPEEA